MGTAGSSAQRRTGGRLGEGGGGLPPPPGAVFDSCSIFTGHSGAVRGLCAADAVAAASIESDGTMIAWDLARRCVRWRNQQQQQQGQGDPVQAVLPAPSVRALLSAAGRSVTLWCVDSGRVAGRFDGGGELSALAVAPSSDSAPESCVFAAAGSAPYVRSFSAWRDTARNQAAEGAGSLQQLLSAQTLRCAARADVPRPDGADDGPPGAVTALAAVGGGLMVAAAHRSPTPELLQSGAPGRGLHGGHCAPASVSCVISCTYDPAVSAASFATGDDHGVVIVWRVPAGPAPEQSQPRAAVHAMAYCGEAPALAVGAECEGQGALACFLLCSACAPPQQPEPAPPPVKQKGRGAQQQQQQQQPCAQPAAESCCGGVCRAAHSRPVTALAWIPCTGGSLLASAAEGDPEVKVWDLQAPAHFEGGAAGAPARASSSAASQRAPPGPGSSSGHSPVAAAAEAAGRGAGGSHKHFSLRGLFAKERRVQSAPPGVGSPAPRARRCCRPLKPVLDPLAAADCTPLAAHAQGVTALAAIPGSGVAFLSGGSDGKVILWMVSAYWDHRRLLLAKEIRARGRRGEREQWGSGAETELQQRAQALAPALADGQWGCWDASPLLQPARDPSQTPPQLAAVSPVRSPGSLPAISPQIAPRRASATAAASPAKPPRQHRPDPTTPPPNPAAGPAGAAVGGARSNLAESWLAGIRPQWPQWLRGAPLQAAAEENSPPGGRARSRTCPPSVSPKREGSHCGSADGGGAVSLALRAADAASGRGRGEGSKGGARATYPLDYRTLVQHSSASFSYGAAASQGELPFGSPRDRSRPRLGSAPALPYVSLQPLMRRQSSGASPGLHADAGDPLSMSPPPLAPLGLLQSPAPLQLPPAHIDCLDSVLSQAGSAAAGRPQSSLHAVD
eukprot:TRINITY_DN8149_c0_g3_i1.p1 TRINITY_DN8149_c0_g3~~TRINITY_DN8149_c0_g3_i1.p1  ORF type:complete len:904 (+),score=228.31 TRINITY_DN8149_c0_g3_i1:41-2752(+)